MAYGSISGRDGSEPRLSQKKALGLALLLGCAASVAFVAGVAVRGERSVSELFALDPSEATVDSDYLQSALGSPGTADGYGLQARQAMLASKQDDRDLAAATRHEAAAKAVIEDDKAQLSSLYSGSMTASDPLGLHTGNLPTVQGLEGLTGYGGRYSASDDAARAAGAASAMSSVTDTQLAGLQSELTALGEKKQSIIDSLSLRRQRTAAHAARDASYADSLRLHRATSEYSARAARDEARVAQIAAQRAKEASVIQKNEEAIAQIAAKRASTMRAYRNAAIAGASQAESDIQGAANSARAARRQHYASAYAATTASLQHFVSQDMATLGQLRSAEEKAAFGPRIGSSTWQEAPHSNDLPDIDPSLFMGDAPFRNDTTLPEFKQADSTQQLSEQDVPQVTAEDNGDSILRVMHEANEELKVLDGRKASAAAAKRRMNSAQLAEHSKVAAQLQQLRALASKEGVSISGSKSPSFSSSSASMADLMGAGQQQVGGGSDHELLAVPDAAGEHSTGAAAAKAQSGGSFTSFPEASLKSVEGSRGDVEALDDGELIRNAKAPVARVAVPLGAHQDASRPSGKAVSAPKPTIVDASTEAMAVRADGSHHVSGGATGGGALRMPHVK